MRLLAALKRLFLRSPEPTFGRCPRCNGPLDVRRAAPGDRYMGGPGTCRWTPYCPACPR